MWLLVTLNLAGKLAAVLVGGTAPATALGLWLVPDALLAYHLFFPCAQGLIRTHCRFRTTEREVWLTIDDGPDPQDTPRLLALLAAHGARATFFAIGQKAASRVTRPPLMKSAVSGKSSCLAAAAILFFPPGQSGRRRDIREE